MSRIEQLVRRYVSAARLATLLVRCAAWLKIPMLAYMRPRVEHLSPERCVLRIPLCRRTRNHVGSMYFGALAGGADAAAGLLAVYVARQRGARLTLLFKDLRAEFLRRADEDVLFVCEDGQGVGALVRQAMQGDARVNAPTQVIAYAASVPDGEPVARFTLTMSLKRR